MAEFSVWSGVPLIMLLTLLAIISSITLLVGAMSEVQEKHFTGHGFIALAVALLLAVVNFISVQRAGVGMAAITTGKPEAVQSTYGKIFSLAALLWAICAGFLGFWVARLVTTLL